MVSIETLDLDTFKNWSRHGLCPKVSIFVKVSIETLDLDTFKNWSRLSRQSLDEVSIGLDVETPRLSFKFLHKKLKRV